MPRKIIRDGAVIDDEWTVVTGDSDSLPQAKLIVPLALWNSAKDELAQRQELGVWLNSDETPQLIAAELDQFAVVAINFPTFADGRGFSYARELRETHGYRGELRAIGAFIRDQLFFLQRCGFNAFALENTDLESAVASLSDFTASYQAAIDQPKPLIKRR